MKYKYINRRNFFIISNIFICIIIILSLVFAIILNRIYTFQSIAVLGKITDAYNEVPQKLIDNIMKQPINQADYNKGKTLLTESGYGQSGVYLIHDKISIFTIIFLILFMGFSASLLIFIIYKNKADKRYESDIINWIRNSKEQPFDTPDHYELTATIRKQNKITERNQHLLEAEKEKIKNFMEDVTHQLKTPLALIRIYCEKTLSTLPDSADRMQSCLKQIDKLSSLIGNLLSIGMFDCNKIHMKFESIRVGDFSELILNDISPLAEKKNINFDVQMDSFEIWFIDNFWMKEAVENILKNGIEHSPENSIIEIEFKQEEHDCFIRISDSGGGFKEDRTAEIFDRFTSSSRRQDGSHGMGLSIAKHVALCHFGKIHAFNNTSGGATFEIMFPKIDSLSLYENNPAMSL